MQNNFNYQELSANALDYLEKRLLYKPSTLRNYRCKWLFVKSYMESQKLYFVTPSVCKDCLLSIYNGRQHSDLSLAEKTLKKSISVLSEFMETGAIIIKKKITHLDGAIGVLMKDFLAIKQSLRLSLLTTQRIESHLSKFNLWLSVNNIFDICSIGQQDATACTPILDTEVHLERLSDVSDRQCELILRADLFVRSTQPDRLRFLSCVLLCTMGITPLSVTTRQFSRLRHDSIQQP